MRKTEHKPLALRTMLVWLQIAGDGRYIHTILALLSITVPALWDWSDTGLWTDELLANVTIPLFPHDYEAKNWGLH